MGFLKQNRFGAVYPWSAAGGLSGCEFYFGEQSHTEVAKMVQSKGLEVSDVGRSELNFTRLIDFAKAEQWLDWKFNDFNVCALDFEQRIHTKKST